MDVTLDKVSALPLKSRTPLEWGRAALSDPIALLVDHAFLEKKAANNALELMTHWPSDWFPGWVEAMTGVARDEGASHPAADPAQRTTGAQSQEPVRQRAPDANAEG